MENETRGRKPKNRIRNKERYSFTLDPVIHQEATIKVNKTLQSLSGLIEELLSKYIGN